MSIFMDSKRGGAKYGSPGNFIYFGAVFVVDAVSDDQ